MSRGAREMYSVGGTGKRLICGGWLGSGGVILAVVSLGPVLAAVGSEVGPVGQMAESVEPADSTGSIDPTGPPEGDDGLSCPRQCHQHSHQVLQECRAGGEPEWVCQRRAWRALGVCLRNCPEAPCRQHCNELGDEVFEQCLADGHSEPVCHQRRGEFVFHCQAGCRPLQGWERCHLVAGRIHHACIEEGGPPEECDQRAQRYVGPCLGGMGPVPCPEKCLLRSELARRRCLEEGGPLEACGDLAEAIPCETRGA